MGTLSTKGLKILLLVLYPLLAMLVASISFAGARSGLRGWHLFADPAHELGVLWGIFSYFGVLMWAAATACCAMGWATLDKLSRLHPLRPWLLASAILSGGLTVDDAFAIHEIVLPGVGIPERAVLLGYAVAIGWYLIRFRRELFAREDSVVFLVSVFLLGSSFAVDMVSRPFVFSASIEELLKLFGITAWLYFFFRVTLGVVTELHSISKNPR
jgi:hypothetical protein